MHSGLAQNKKCSKCAQVKARAEFPVRRASKDGLSYTCKACAVESSRIWRSKNRLRHRSYSSQWQKDNKPQVNARCRDWRARNPQRRKDVVKAWQARNQDYLRAKLAERRAKIVTPAWADKRKIARFYSEAVRLTKATGIAYQVDHLVPLNSPLVCGLHVETNLQVIAAVANNAKGNRVWPDMP